MPLKSLGFQLFLVLTRPAPSTKCQTFNVSWNVRKIRRLTPLKIASLKKPGRHADGGGLELQISKTGTKSWLFRYAAHGREHRMGLGSLHDFTLAEARERARVARQQLADGQDPLLTKRKVKVDAMKVMTFREAADQFMKVKLKGFRSDVHKRQWKATLEIAHRVIGSVPVDAVDTAMVLRVLRPIWDETPTTASRLRGRIERVISYAIASGMRADESNPAGWKGHLQDVFPAKPKIQHFAAVDYRELPEIMQRLRATDGVAARALEFCILTAARSGEVLGATWSEINLAERTWTIPGDRMKKGLEHCVPLSDRAVKILQVYADVVGLRLPLPQGRREGHARHAARRPASARGQGLHRSRLLLELPRLVWRAHQLPKRGGWSRFSENRRTRKPLYGSPPRCRLWVIS